MHTCTTLILSLSSSSKLQRRVPGAFPVHYWPTDCLTGQLIFSQVLYPSLGTSVSATVGNSWCSPFGVCGYHNSIAILHCVGARSDSMATRQKQISSLSASWGRTLDSGLDYGLDWIMNQKWVLLWWSHHWTNFRVKRCLLWGTYIRNVPK